MTKPTSPAPGSLHGLTPRLIVKDAARAIAFYCDVLGAQEISRFADEKLGGLIVHAELRLGDSTVTLAEEHVEWHNCAPPTLGGSSVILNLEVDDADALGARMVQAGSRWCFRSPISSMANVRAACRIPSGTCG